MSTNAIGSGTCNLSINVPTDERAELGRLAFQAGAKSTADFLRALVLHGLEQQNAAAAARVKDIRRRYYGSALLTIFVASLVVHPLQDMRRSRVRVEELSEREEEVLS